MGISVAGGKRSLLPLGHLLAKTVGFLRLSVYGADFVKRPMLHVVMAICDFL